MSMISCPECGKMFSDLATACPNCGCPISSAKKALAAKENCKSAQAESTMRLTATRDIVRPV